MEFLLQAKKLLELTRKILLPASVHSTPEKETAGEENPGATGTNSGNPPSMEYTYAVWQHEMEKAYDGLIETLTPYLTVLSKEDPLVSESPAAVSVDNRIRLEQIQSVNLKRNS